MRILNAHWSLVIIGKTALSDWQMKIYSLSRQHSWMDCPGYMTQRTCRDRIIVWFESKSIQSFEGIVKTNK